MYCVTVIKPKKLYINEQSEYNYTLLFLNTKIIMLVIFIHFANTPSHSFSTLKWKSLFLQNSVSNKVRFFL